MIAFRRLAATCFVVLLLLMATRGDATIDPARRDRDLAAAVSRAQADAIARVMPAVVSISALGKGGEEFGSGLIVGSAGEVLSALHVVRHATAIAVRLDDGTEYAAERVAEDAYADLVLLRLRVPPGRSFRAAQLGDEDALRPGETLLVVGNPFGLGGSVSRGVLSAHRRRRVLPDTGVNLLQTDASINPGCSGGPVINLSGEVVGLVTAILSRTGGDQGIGFAVPASELRRSIRYLRQGKAVPRARLGFTIKVRNGPEAGLSVLRVRTAGPAAKAGVRAGDVVLRLNGRRVERIEELRTVLRSIRAGDRVRIGLRRGTALLDLWATTESLTKP